ncbi:MAG: hypothetical protein K5657_00785 [Desulfovibrio sp.]|nr:hypothetical protein [Desulfovibrio sp.]
MLRSFLLLLLLLLFAVPVHPLSACAGAESDSSRLIAASMETKSLQQSYLREARSLRKKGRLELAREKYLLSLSIASDTRTVEEIRKELDGLELMIRTLR